MCTPVGKTMHTKPFCGVISVIWREHTHSPEWKGSMYFYHSEVSGLRWYGNLCVREFVFCDYTHTHNPKCPQLVHQVDHTHSLVLYTQAINWVTIKTSDLHRACTLTPSATWEAAVVAVCGISGRSNSNSVNCRLITPAERKTRLQLQLYLIRTSPIFLYREGKLGNISDAFFVILIIL